MENIQEKFTKFLKEEPFDKGQAHGFARVGAPGGVPSVDDVVDGDAFNVQKPEMLLKINGYLSAASATPVLNPYFLVNRIQTKLMEIGLTFDTPSMVGQVGSTSKSLKQFGGTYGYKPDAGKANEYGFPAMTSTNGNADGLSITFTWTCHKGLYTVEAEIVHTAKPSPQPIGEDKKKLNLGEDVDLTKHSTAAHAASAIAKRLSASAAVARTAKTPDFAKSLEAAKQAHATARDAHDAAAKAHHAAGSHRIAAQHTAHADEHEKGSQ